MLSWIGSIFEPHVSKVAGSIFDYNVEDIEGQPLELSSLKGKKVYLVVNVASK
jgi:glutathione peroxidase-family protein